MHRPIHTHILMHTTTITHIPKCLLFLPVAEWRSLGHALSWYSIGSTHSKHCLLPAWETNYGLSLCPLHSSMSQLPLFLINIDPRLVYRRTVSLPMPRSLTRRPLVSSILSSDHRWSSYLHWPRQGGSEDS